MSKILNMQVGDLKVHPQYDKIYKNTEIRIAALEEAIVRQGGIQTPLIVSPNNVIIDGVLRLLVAKKLGYETVPCIIQNYADEQEEVVKIIDLNKHRIKTDSELFNEIKLLKENLKPQQGKRSDLTGDKPVNTRNQIANKINKTPSYVQQIEFIGNSTEGEFLLNQLDSKKISIAKAYDLAKDDIKNDNRKSKTEDVPRSILISDIEVCACPHCNQPIFKRDIIK